MYIDADKEKEIRNMKNRLKEILKQREWTYMDLALKTKLDPAHISKIANEQGGVNLKTAIIIAGALDMPVEQIFVRESEKIPEP